jgi:predicted amino acid dehydrogenase
MRPSITMSELDKGELGQLQAGKIFVAGHRGMVGSAIVRQLQGQKCKQIIRRT